MAIGRFVIILILIAQCAASRPPHAKTCVDNCYDRRAGFYQSCQGCDFFTTCIWGHVFTMKCVNHNVWDDYWKSCQPTSTTCPERSMSEHPPASSARPSFLTDIVKMLDTIVPRLKYTFGYQRDMQKHNPARKQYGKPWNSEQVIRRAMPVSAKPTPVHQTDNSRGRPCVNRCGERHLGYYSLCGSCKKYVYCDNGFIYIQTCKGGKEWDERRRICVARSTTCRVK